MIWPKKKLPDLNSIPLSLNGFRVLLRPAVLADYESWKEVRSRNKDYLVPFEPRWHAEALDEKFFQRRIARQHKEWKEGRAYSFLITDRQTNEIIGGININHVCRGAAQSGSLGYWIDEKRQGQGFTAESLRLVIDFAFDQIGLYRLNAACLPHNTRSINLLSKAGFAEEGFARNYIQINGKWEDHKLFGLNNTED